MSSSTPARAGQGRASLHQEITEKIGELDGQIIDQACPESLLAAEISERLGFN